MKKIIISISVLTLLLMPAFVVVFAQSETLPKVNITSKQDILNVLISIRNWFSGLVAIISIFVILYAGFQFLTAGGNPETLGKAKSTLMYGLIGIGVAILAAGILQLMASFMGTS